MLRKTGGTTPKKRQNKTAYFSVDILFDQAFDFELEEIADAVAQDYPQAAVAVHPLHAGKQIMTDEVVLGMLNPLDPRNGHVVIMNGLGHPDEEFRNADNSEVAWRSGAFAHCAMAAIKSHKSYMTLSVQTADQSLDGLFRAVRQLMAVSAVFAELPIALGVLTHWSSHMVAPGTWVKATQKSMRGAWPLYEWISYRCGWDVQGRRSRTRSVGYTKGLRNFAGYELHVAAAPIPPSDVKLLLRDTCRMILRHGRTLRDGDVLNFDNNPSAYQVVRSRNAKGDLAPVIVLLHPETQDFDVSDTDFAASAFAVEWSPPRPNPNFLAALLDRQATAIS